MNLQLIFKSVLNMSLTGSVVICFVLIVRMLLKKAPKMFSYALWAVVLFRLLCPVSFTSAFSLLGFTRATVSEPESVVTSVEYAPVQDIYQHKQENTEAEQAEPDHDYELPEVHPDQSIPENRTEVTQTPDAVSQQAPAEPVREPIYYAVMIWLVGMGVMLMYNVYSYRKLGKKIVGAVRLRKNIYLADHIPSPFVMGILRPKIYLPSALEPSERRYIIAHERYHIRRKDHIIKLLAYIALCIHWFNPLVWVAFAMSGKDMEMSCDEAVIRMFGLDIRAEYSASLLRLATDHRIIAGTPLAFGEGDTKGRVLNMAKWKKPNFWVVICAAIVCIGVLAACAMNPAETIPQADTVSTIPTGTQPPSTQTPSAPTNYPILFLDGIEGDSHAYVLCAIDSGELKLAEDYLYNGKPLSDYYDCSNEAVSSEILDTAQEFTFINANGMTFQTGIDGLTCTDRPIDESFAVCAKVDGQPGEKSYYLGSYTGVSLLPADMTVEDKLISADLDGDGRLDTVSWAFTPANPEDYGERFNYTITVSMGGTSCRIESDEYYPCKEADLTIFVADLDQNGSYELVVCENSLSKFRSVTVYRLKASTAEAWLTYVIDPEP